MLALAASRLRFHKALALAQVAALAGATALMTAVSVVGGGAAEAGYRTLLLDPHRNTAIDVESRAATSPQDFDRFQTTVRQSFDQHLGSRVDLLATYSRSTPWNPLTLNGKPTAPAEGLHVTIGTAFEPDLTRHATVHGRWPADGRIAGAAIEDTYEAAISDVGADVLGLTLGDLYCANGSSAGQAPAILCARLVGTWHPRAALDPYWRVGPSGFDLILGRSAYFASANLSNDTTSFAGRAYVPDAAQADAADAETFSTALTAAKQAFALAGDVYVLTQVDSTLTAYLATVSVNRFSVEMVTVALLLIGVYAAVFMWRQLLVAQQPAVALWRIRGWRRRDTATLLLSELALLAILSVPLGLLLGAAIGWIAIGRSTPVGVPIIADLLAPLVGAGAIAAIGFCGAIAVQSVLFARRSLATLRSGSDVTPTTPWWTRRNLDLVAGLLAIPLLIEARLRGSVEVRAVDQNDNLGLMLPAIALVLLAVGSLRLLPLAAWIAGARSRVSTAAHLAAIRLSRQPADHAGLALLLAVAVAIGTFAATYSATAQRNIADRAAYATGADLRVGYADATAASTVAGDMAAASVAAWTPVWRTQSRVGFGSQGADILAVDPAGFESVAWTRPDLATPSIRSQLDDLANTDPDGIRINDQPADASVWIYSPGSNATAALNLVDANGQHCSCSLGSLGYSGWRQLHAAVMFPSPPTYPLRLIGLGVSKPRGAPLTLALSDLSVGSQLVQAFGDDGGWWSRDDSGAAAGLWHQSAAVPARDGRASWPVALSSTQTSLELLPPTPTKAVPALVSAGTAQRFGLHLGGQVPARVGENTITLKIAGLVDAFPTYYPDDDFFVTPLDATLHEFAYPNYSQLEPNESWVRVSGDAAPVVTVIRKDPNVRFVESRQEKLAAATNAPVYLQLRATLAVGFEAALALALLGFVVHFVSLIRRRSSDFAILHANGVPRSLVAASIAWEQAVVVGFSLVAGAGLGLVLSFSLLPVLQLGATVDDLIPPTIVTFDFVSLGLGAVSLGLSTLIAARLVRRLARPVSPLDELRRLG